MNKYTYEKSKGTLLYYTVLHKNYPEDGTRTTIATTSDAEKADFITKSCNNFQSGYQLIQFPESQKYMDEPWFEEEAILAMHEEINDSSYFIPNEYITQ